jgi:hypothetical protein
MHVKGNLLGSVHCEGHSDTPPTAWDTTDEIKKSLDYNRNLSTLSTSTEPNQPEETIKTQSVTAAENITREKMWQPRPISDLSRLSYIVRGVDSNANNLSEARWLRSGKEITLWW